MIGTSPRVGAGGARAAAWTASLALLSLLGGCGGETGAAALAPAAGPAAFADESYAELATDGQGSLWLAVAGYDGDREFGLRVFRRESAGWAQAPTPPGRVSSDLPISLVARGTDAGDTPCVGYSVGGAWAPVIACLSGEEWVQEELPPIPAGQLNQIGVAGEGLVALIYQARKRQPGYRLLSEDGQGGWELSAPIPAPPAIAKLAIEPGGDSATPAVGLATQGLNGAKHLVFELSGDRWARLRPSLSDAGTGPLVGGPVLLPGRVLFPVNEADSEPWAFSVVSGRPGSRATKATPISTGAGNAQGRLDLAGDRLWATWQEDDPRRDGRFRAWIFAAEIDPTGAIRRKVRLWRGLAIGPGSTQVIEYRGKPVALFMRASANGRGLKATVRTLP